MVRVWDLYVSLHVEHVLCCKSEWNDFILFLVVSTILIVIVDDFLFLLHLHNGFMTAITTDAHNLSLHLINVWDSLYFLLAHTSSRLDISRIASKSWHWCWNLQHEGEKVVLGAKREETKKFSFINFKLVFCSFRDSFWVKLSFFLASLKAQKLSLKYHSFRRKTWGGKILLSFCWLFSYITYFSFLAGLKL